MKVRYVRDTDPSTFTKGKIYDVMSIENGWYRIVDETGEDYLYAPENFEVIDEQLPLEK